MKTRIKYVANINMLFCSDFHFGSRTGLTPPAYWRNDLRKYQKERWRHWLTAKKYGPYHVIIENGDAIDGAGKRIGSAEALEADISEQPEGAKECMLPMIKPGVTTNIVLTRGTDYHVRSPDGAVDVEKAFCDKLKALVPNVTLMPRQYVQINSQKAARPFVILCRHDVPKGSNRMGGAGPGTLRTLAALRLEMDSMGTPDFDMAVFAHVHEYFWGEQFNTRRRSTLYVSTLPGLQGKGTHFGDTKCIGTINFGYIVVELSVDQRGNWWVGHLPVIGVLKADKEQITRINADEVVTV